MRKACERITAWLPADACVGMEWTSSVLPVERTLRADAHGLRTHHRVAPC